MTFTPEQKLEIDNMVKEAMKKELPNLFGRSLVQLKEYFITNIL